MNNVLNQIEAKTQIVMGTWDEVSKTSLKHWEIESPKAQYLSELDYFRQNLVNSVNFQIMRFAYLDPKDNTIFTQDFLVFEYLSQKVAHLISDDEEPEIFGFLIK